LAVPNLSGATGELAVLPNGSPLLAFLSPPSLRACAPPDFECATWGTAGATLFSGVAAYQEVALTVQRDPPTLRIHDKDGAVLSALIAKAVPPSNDAGKGGQVTAAGCAGVQLGVAWTTETNAGTGALRFAKQDASTEDLTIAHEWLVGGELGQPAIEPSCAIVAPALPETGAYRRWQASESDPETLSVDMPQVDGSVHAVVGASKLFLTTQGSRGIEVLACPAGAAAPAECVSTNLGCQSVGGMAARGDDPEGDRVVFTCGNDLYVWSP
jgi:hypothetical protein